MTSILDDDPSDVTQNAFLGGRLQILQPRLGYRAGVDPVLLAACVSADASDHVLDLGCGVGVAGLCLTARTGARVAGLERQPGYADLARRNAVANGLPFDVVTGDLLDMPSELRQISFDHVITNPPYFVRGQGTPAAETSREIALAEAAPLSAWVDAAVRRLRPRGTLTVILKAARFPDLLAACDTRLGDVTVLPIMPRVGRPIELVVLRAVKGMRGEFRLQAPLVTHIGARHESDGDSFTDTMHGVLREGRAMDKLFDRSVQR